ncbi:MAG: hypothetical protein JOY99_07800 [Sphingomonadaceae bacterium]|nr:hypothetical protein [Sphingomonadaceae bacterium]
MAMRRGVAVVAIGLLGLAAAADAGPKGTTKRPEPKILTDTFTCSGIADDHARLVCFDRAVAALKQAYAADDLLVADRESVRKAKRSLFGLSLPSFDLFGGGGDREDSQIDVAVQAARFESDGSVTVTLESAGTWRQVDDNSLPSLPKPGDKVTVKKGALGSYWISYGRYAFKAHRVN